MIKVLIADDSALDRQILSKWLEADPEIKIIGTARDGKDAIDKVKALKPDIALLDVHMPTLGGLDATEHIMAFAPTPIVLLAGNKKPSQEFIKQALGKGALWVSSKPSTSTLNDDSPEVKNFISEIKKLSRIHVIAHPAGQKRTKHFQTIPNPLESPTKVIAIACSTGGPKLLAELISAFPKDFPAAVLIVQHLSEGFSEELVQWLQREASLPVVLAKPGDLLESGIVYFAQSGSHLAVRRGGILGIDNTPPLHGCCPSADVLMNSIARVYGNNAIGVILTGMGEDGAEGIKAIHKAGGKTIAQNEDSALVFGMPKAAIDLGGVDFTLPAEEIPQKLIQLVTDPFAWYEK